ncbi:MAG: FixH family protein, partial [Chloroflexi bacterium]|nr:FixH family protein [Chloroflexota bacterium]
LAAWQYGLGRSVAWTSDATGRWAKNWVGWENFPRFWTQAVRWTINEGSQDNVAATVTRDGENATITVDTLTSQGDYINSLTLQANVVDPNGKTQTVTLAQTAPGRYAATFAPGVEGPYLIRVAGGDGTNSVAQTAGWVLSYSPEYRTLKADPSAMARLAAIAGGRITTGDPAEAFAHTLPARRATRPAWPWLILLATILLPFDVAARRLVVTRHDLARWWSQLREWGRLTRPAAQPVPERAGQLTALFRAKERAGDKDEGRGVKDEAAAEATFVPAPTAKASSNRDAPPAKKPEPAPTGDQLASTLLAKKKARGEEQKK